MAQRQTWLDVLKGIAIFLVVCGHVLLACMNGTDTSVPFRLIANIHMPLFFFISGWLAYRCARDGSGRIVPPAMRRRVPRLVLPMVAVSTLFIFYHNHSGLYPVRDVSFEWLWANAAKQGYWFTLVLLAEFCFYRLLTPVLNMARTLPGRVAVCMGAYGVLIVLNKLMMPYPVWNWVAFNSCTCYFVPFMFGVLARSEQDTFLALTSRSGYVTAAFLILAVPMYYMSFQEELPANMDWSRWIARPLIHICVAVIALALFRPVCVRADADTAAGDRHRWLALWSYLGRNSLGIYLLHYFFLFPVKHLQALLGFPPESFAPNTLLACCAAAVTVAATCMVIELIRPSRQLSYIFTGS